MIMALSIIAIVGAGGYVGYRTMTVGYPSQGWAIEYCLSVLVFIAGVLGMVLGNPFWPEATLKFLMCPVIGMMALGVGNFLGGPNPHDPMSMQVWGQHTLRGLMTFGILLGVLVVLLVILT